MDKILRIIDTKPATIVHAGGYLKAMVTFASLGTRSLRYVVGCGLKVGDPVGGLVVYDSFSEAMAEFDKYEHEKKKRGEKGMKRIENEARIKALMKENKTRNEICVLVGGTKSTIDRKVRLILDDGFEGYKPTNKKKVNKNSISPALAPAASSSGAAGIKWEVEMQGLPALDPEISLLGYLVRALYELDDHARKRVVAWLNSRYGRPGEKQT